ncbi:hypothetical protein FN846DRAFT_979614 [Sphaerosporella brunnea]|uniref:Uncharacterized protein n=1 Tax=Sphaerosporella brunnea TaxID=1250544 RepID=A0A5J5ED62_9PEZI|nr:hypothetical protein FN846DRAFT_979614 [Sphaerosporella brunnea]
MIPDIAESRATFTLFPCCVTFFFRFSHLFSGEWLAFGVFDEILLSFCCFLFTLMLAGQDVARVCLLLPFFFLCWHDIFRTRRA